MEADDLSLVEKARAGEADAFRALVVRYQRKVYAVALGIVKDPDLAWDVAQETFVRVHRGLGDFEEKSSFSTWLFRIATHLGIDAVRRERTSRKDDLDDVAEAHVAAAGEGILATALGNDPRENVLRRELAGKIQDALATLPEKHRTILVLREVEGRCAIVVENKADLQASGQHASRGVRTSALTGEGIPDLLMVLVGLAQRFLEETLKFHVTGPGIGTILEVKEERGLGFTIDTIIYDGVVKVGDTVVIGGRDKPFATKIRALLKPKPNNQTAAHSFVEDLEAWEKQAGVKLSAGDVLLLRTGRWARRAKLGPCDVAQRTAGLHASVAPWVKARGIAMVGSDAAEDVTPSMVEGLALPVHTLFIAGMGTVGAFLTLDPAALALSLLAGIGAAASAVALTGTPAWLISRAAEQPPILYLMVAIVAVRAFGVSRGALRYAERLPAHLAEIEDLVRLAQNIPPDLPSVLLIDGTLPLFAKTSGDESHQISISGFVSMRRSTGLLIMAPSFRRLRCELQGG